MSFAGKNMNLAKMWVMFNPFKVSHQYKMEINHAI